MKLLLIILLYSIALQGQTKFDDIMASDSLAMSLGTFEFSSCISMGNKEGKELRLDFSGDTLKVFGDLPYNQAANTFLNHLIGRYSRKLDSLELLKKEIAELRFFYTKHKVAKQDSITLGAKTYALKDIEIRKGIMYFKDYKTLKKYYTNLSEYWGVIKEEE